MPNRPTLWTTSCRRVLVAIGVLCAAATGPAAWAQTTHPKAPVHRIKGVGSHGVTVRARPRRPPVITPDPDKRAGFDTEAAKAETWKKYRSNSPSLGEKTLDQANGYPGLHTLLPPN